MIRFYRFVRLNAVAEYEAKGWRVADCMADCHHGRHAVIMHYTGEGEPD